MQIEQIYTGCLAEAAYYIESDGEAAVIDPLRDTLPYMKRAQKNNARIKYVFETHFHADFVSGHIDLAEKSGAEIVFGPDAVTDFKSYIARDGEEFGIGSITLKVLHTPGHTLESTTYLLIDEEGDPYAIFSGDTLFIGDVGRPDLAIKSDISQEDLAGMLYDSLHHKIFPLPDNVIIYPAHGAGSACGKSISKETSDTLGHQKLVNYALQPMSKLEFVKKVTEGILPPPQYFPKNALLNKTGYVSFDEVSKQGFRELSPLELEYIVIHQHALIIDARDSQIFGKGFIPGSINIGLGGQFAPWVGALIVDIKHAIVLVTETGKEEEAITRLARVGYDNTLGYLKGGFESWKNAGKPIDYISSVTCEKLEYLINDESVNILDVRKPTEYELGHIVKVENKPLDFLNDWMPTLDKKKSYYIHCAAGYRSMIAASILKSRGFENVYDIEGGYTALKQTGISLTNDASSSYERYQEIY